VSDGDAGERGTPAVDARGLFAGHEPFAGFDLGVVVDRPVYAAGDTVRITVSATNHADRYVEHRYPGWQRYHLGIRDEFHRTVADTEVTRTAEQEALDRWLPGQMVIFPTWWAQQEGPVVPAWSSDRVGPRVAPGRYRVRVRWLGREPGSRAEAPEAVSPWFELV
jgi:hypothetical protein